ncbi:hypothetical protein AMS68_004258 [Peltaster fructicola]|uniref:DUF7165 domain-containing protein n=1 Tax=Peltaster fructicola TaxID=286661 RepID=A0A6H0XVQ6_9PEZI|nr:hypothetical protein AMS68_004258 [Peltaster fructicola]
MPVSRSTSGAGAARSEAHTTVTRWNSTRERASPEERRFSQYGNRDVNTTAFQDPPNWPLSYNAMSPISPEQHTAWKQGNHQHKNEWDVEHDVSDIEDEDDHDDLGERLEDDKRRPSDESIQDRAPRDSGRVVNLEPKDSTKVSPMRTDFAHEDSPQSSSAASSASARVDASRAERQVTATHDALVAEEANEAHDRTPPMPSELFQTTPEHILPTPRPRRPPLTNGADPQHSRQSSLAKNGYTGFHSRQSSHNTTQIPHNKDWVRYSWQSIHDDGPNRPRIHIIKLVSNTTTASSAFPQGEAFGFSISPGGRRIAAFDSSRLYILQTAALPVGISQDFSLKRRPLAVELNDAGSIVAILADPHTVNVYDLSNSRLRRSKTFKLDFPANCVAVAPCGGLIAASYEGGIEVFSLAQSAIESDRRAVRAPRMDRLAFSEDGSTLLGTTTRIHASSTVLINVPVFPSAPNNIPTPEELKLAWCSELLHPENIRNSSHATFMREDRHLCNERLFAWNGSADTFGILNTSDMEYGNADFPVVIQPPLATCGGLGAAVHSCPAVDEFGDTVAMIVNDRTIRLYIVPPKSEDNQTTIEAHSIDHELDEGYGNPFSELRWVHSHSALPAPVINDARVKGRLIVTSPGGVFAQEQSEETFEEIEGGRIILFDFDAQFAGQPGQTFVLNLGKSPPQPLEEEEYDVADAVALVRRRTVKQNKAGDMSQRPVSFGRAATTANSNRNSMRPLSVAQQSRRTASVMSIASSVQSDAARDLPDLAEGVEAADAMEEPFSMTAPRSQASLQRAASNVQRHRFQALEERNQEGVSSEGSGNFLALPEYSEEPNAPLPSRFRAMAGLDAPTMIADRLGYGTAVPMSAPPGSAESFSAEEAFAAANATMAANRRGNASSMPRGLMRAYSNAANPGVQQLNPQASVNFSVPSFAPVSEASRARTSHFREEPDMSGGYPAYQRAYDHRFSTPLASLLEQANAPRRSSSTRRPGEFVYGSVPRSYSQNSFRQPAPTTASLFPQTMSSDHVPLPLNRSAQAIGGVAHPVTSWRPPAPSIVNQPLPSSNPGHTRAHSRKSSLANKQAFASTAKAKKLGFFRRGKHSKTPSGDDSISVMDDARSMATWRTASDKKCTVM